MAQQIKTWVANTWVKLLQTTGQSTNKAMSQKAVTDSLDSLKSDLDSKAKTSDVLTYEELMASNIDVTNKIAGADNISKLIANGIFNIKYFHGWTHDNTSVTFTNVPLLDSRVSAIFVGNANGSPDFRYCALFDRGTAEGNRISSGSITATDNGDGTANVTISEISAWGNYRLIVFYG